MTDWAGDLILCSKHVRRGSQNGQAPGRGQGSCWSCWRLSQPGHPSSHSAAVSMFSLCESHISQLENTQPLPLSVFPHKAPFCLFVFVIIWLIPTCLLDSTGVHTSLRGEEKEMSIANLLKGKRDSHCFFFLWGGALFRGQDVNSLCPRKEWLLCAL